MGLTLYDAFIPTFIRTTEAVAGVLKKGRDFYTENGLDLETLPSTALCGDMLPLSFQINSVRHQSINAVECVKSGVFSPPGPLEKTDYASLEQHIQTTIADLKALTPDEVNALEGKDMMFVMGELKIPFEATGFLSSFATPNFFFHATTTYDILRMKGVPLSKQDFLGRLMIKRG